MATLTPAAVTAITDLMLACEAFLLAGLTAGRPKARFSAAWFWAGTLLLLGLGALIGGIDHGFFEPAHLPRYLIQRINWIVLGAMTFCLLMATAKQFFPPRIERVALASGLLQFAVDSVFVLMVDSFLDVILNYAPVIVLLLAMNVAGLKKGTGSWPMIAGILIQFAASAIQAIGVDTWSPLDHNGLYHVVSMIGVLFLYLGGKRLNPR
ncbi:MAG TPA: hypothetical protein VGH38_12940 [Bryobacteraceae bacterium]|jgi:ABC-type uncharacterized transport system permease subunit